MTYKSRKVRSDDKKYLVCPGHNKFENGRIEYVGADTLITNYKVRKEHCLITKIDSVARHYDGAMIVLEPKIDGIYDLKYCRQVSTSK